MEGERYSEKEQKELGRNPPIIINIIFIKSSRNLGEMSSLQVLGH